MCKRSLVMSGLCKLEMSCFAYGGPSTDADQEDKSHGSAIGHEHQGTGQINRIRM